MDNTIPSLISQSQALSRAGRVGAAYHLAQQAVRQARSDDDAAILSRALTTLAHVHFRLGHY